MAMNSGRWGRGLVPGVLLVLSLVGCGGGDRREGSALDSVLIRTEALITRERDRDARWLLRDSYLSSPSIWRGPSFPEGLRMLGELYQSSALFDSAFFFYSRSREEHRNLAHRSRAYQMTFAIGELLLQMNRPQDARDLYEETLRLALVFNDGNDARDLRWALVPVYAALEERDNEQKMLAHLLNSARTAHDGINEARVHYETGLSLAARGEPAAAIDAYLRAVTLADQAKDSLLSEHILMHLGLAFEADGRGQDAVETFTAALNRAGTLEHNPDLHIELLMRTGNLHLRRNQGDVAVQSFRTALSLAQQRQNGLAEGYCSVQMAHATLRRNRTEAMQLFRSGYDQFNAFGFKPGIAYALASLGDIAARESRLTDALKLYSAAAKAEDDLVAGRAPDDLLTECAVSALGPAGNDASASYVSLLLQLGKEEEAFVAQQRKHNRSLASAFSTWAYRTGKPLVDSVLAEYSRQRTVCYGAERELEHLVSTRPGDKVLLRDIHAVLQDARERMKEYVREIQRLRPDLAPIVGADGMSPADIQKRLPDRTALLTFIPSRRSWYTALVTKDHVALEVSGQSTARVIQSAQEFMQTLRERIAETDSMGAGRSSLDGQLRNSTRVLHEALILPVEDWLRSDMRVLVQFPPDMPVIPVHALRRGGSSGSSFVIERYDIQYIPTVHTLGLRPPSAGPVQTVACIGFQGTTTWDVEYELRDVRYFFKDAGMCFKWEATADTLLKIRSDVLHLAADIRFGLRSPLLGGIVLSDGTSPTGWRRTPLAFLTRLPAHRLVIVSNLASLPWALDPGFAYVFAANGSEGMIINAVPPLRGAKKAFGEYLYTALQTGASPEAAFRSAAREMIDTRDLAGPQYWAPFMYWRGN